MNLKEYYEDYKNNKTYTFKLPFGEDITVDNFYEHCIKPTMLPKESLLAWHKMLLKYVERDDAIFWVRYYEGSSKKDGIDNKWRNRRGCYTEFNDGFSYVFVSNFDVQEIFNMVSKNIIPNDEEFLCMMKDRSFPLHYDPSGRSCEESSISSYKNIDARSKTGVLNVANWYFAHIYDVKWNYFRKDGSKTKITQKECDRIFPRGEVADWKKDDMDGFIKRKIDYSLSPEEKELVKAHFLRFVDPLNYFLAPKTSFEVSDYTTVTTRIGEKSFLTQYMSDKMGEVYGKDVINDYYEKIKVNYKLNYESNLGDKIINIKYGKKMSCDDKPKTDKSSPKKIKDKKTSERKTEKKPSAKVEIIFDPKDRDQFVTELLKTKKAIKKYEFEDGHVEEHKWEADNFKSTSNLLGNIRSHPTYKKNKPSLNKVTVRILYD